MVNEYEDGLLYEGGGFRITSNPRGVEEHNLWVGPENLGKDNRKYFMLPRGVLKEIGERTNPEKARGMMDTMTQGNFSFALDDMSRDGTKLTSEVFVIACARARITEWKDMFHSAAKDARQTRQ